MTAYAWLNLNPKYTINWIQFQSEPFERYGLLVASRSFFFTKILVIVQSLEKVINESLPWISWTRIQLPQNIKVKTL